MRREDPHFAELYKLVQKYIEKQYIEKQYVEEPLVEDSPVEPYIAEAMEERCCGKYSAAPASGFISLPKSARSLEDLLEEVEETFSESVLHWIDRKGKSDPEVYKKANLDRKLFSKIRGNADYRPSKSTALALAIGLELNLDETKDLIGRAGYALSHSSKGDIIVEYYINHEIYDLAEINDMLYEFGQPLIGK